VRLFSSSTASASSRRCCSVDERFRLLDGVVGARQGIDEIERGQPVARHAVALHPPQGCDPQRRMFTITVHEQDRRDARSPPRGRTCLRQCRKAQMAGQQGQRPGTLQDRPPRQAHFVTFSCFQELGCAAPLEMAA
jgi:hypothetical protein